MERINNATVLRGKNGDTILYPGRKYRIDTGSVVIDNCEFARYDLVDGVLLFLIDRIEVCAKASLIASIEEVSECNTTDN